MQSRDVPERFLWKNFRSFEKDFLNEKFYNFSVFTEIAEEIWNSCQNIRYC